MVAEDGVLGLRFVNALVPFVVDLGDRGVDAGQFGQILQVNVHLLVADDGKNTASREDMVFVLFRMALA